MNLRIRNRQVAIDKATKQERTAPRTTPSPSVRARLAVPRVRLDDRFRLLTGSSRTAEALIEQLGYRREPADQASLATFVARTREALGAAAFAAAETSGRALSYQEAIVEARAWLEQDS